MRHFLFPILVLACAGCATRAAPTATAGGRTGYEFSCGGLFSSGTDCALQATRYCANGYFPVFESPSRLVAICAAPEARTAAARPAAEQPVGAVAAPPPAEQPLTALLGVGPQPQPAPRPEGAYAGASSAGVSLVSPVRAQPEDLGADSGPQPLSDAQKDELFRNFDAYLANQPGRHPRSP